MNIDMLIKYSIPVIVCICICLGYILKNIVTSNNIIQHRFLITGIIGIALNIWINATVSPGILLGGLFSGFTGTWLHQTFTKLTIKERE